MKKILFILLVLLANIAFGQTMIRLSQIEPVVVSNTGTSTDKAIAKFNGTNGRVIQNSGVTIDDSNNIREASSLFFYNNVYQLGTSGQLDINPYSTIRFGRETNNANFSFQIFKGDNTATVNHYFKGNGFSYLVVNNGNLGIGTSSDSGEKLQVNGKINTKGWVLSGGELATTGYGLNAASGIGTGRLLTGTNLSSLHTFADDAALEISVGSSAAYKTGISFTGRYWSGTPADELGFWTRGTKNAVIKGATGDILINTETDNGVDKLQVNGTISGSNATLSNQAVMLGQLSISNWNTAYGWGNWASNFGTTTGTIAQGNDSRISNGQTAYGWGNHAGLYKPVAYVPAWSEITGKPTFSTVATTGSYNDLLDKPAAYSLPLAANGTRGGMQIGYTSTANNFALQLSSEKAFTALPDATTTVKGIASFNTNHFSTSSGIVSLNSESITSTEIADGAVSYPKLSVYGIPDDNDVLWFSSTHGLAWKSPISDGDKGEITVSGSSWTVDNGTIGYSKLSAYGTPSDGDMLTRNSTYGLSWVTPVSGSGSSDRIALWTGTKTLSSDADYSFNSTTNVLTVGSGSGNGYVTSGNFVNNSDRRLKERIRKMENLNWVDEIEFKNFEFKGDTSDRLRYGVIAQEVKKINPELVYNDENGFYAVGYIDLLIAKVARQDQIIEELIKRIEKLENEK